MRLTEDQIEDAIIASIDKRADQARLVGTLSAGAGVAMFLLGVPGAIALAPALLGVIISQRKYSQGQQRDQDVLPLLSTGQATVDDLDDVQIAALEKIIRTSPRKINPSLTPINHGHTEQTGVNSPNEDHDEISLSHTRPIAPPVSGGSEAADLGDGPNAGAGTLPPSAHPVPAPSVDVAVAPPVADPVDVGGIAGAYGEVIASITDMDGPTAKPRHIALLAITQCGKTTTIGAISYALKERYPDAQFHALDAKNSNWPEFYQSVCFPGYGLSFDPLRAIDAVRSVYRELERRVTGQLKGDRLQPRLLLVLDEWNKTREDIATKVDKTLLGELDAMVGGIVFQGLEFGVHLCMVLQEANCTKIGLTDSGRLNIHFLALARAGERSMVDALLDNGMVLKSRAQCDRLRRDFERIWNDRNRPAQSPVIVDSRSYSAEALPSLTSKITLVNHHDNTGNHSQPNPISGRADRLPRSGVGVPDQDPGPRIDGGDRLPPTGGAVGISANRSRVNGGAVNESPRNQNSNSRSPQERPIAPLLPDLWEPANAGESGVYRNGINGTRAGKLDPTVGGQLATLPPDSELLAMFRSGWGLHGIALKYKLSDSSPEFEHLKSLEQRYQAEPKN